MTLIEAVRAAIRRLHFSPRTEEAHVHWIRAYIRHHGSGHPRDLGAEDITTFLNHLAVEGRVASLVSRAESNRDAGAPCAASRGTSPALRRTRRAGPFWGDSVTCA